MEYVTHKQVSCSGGQWTRHVHTKDLLIHTHLHAADEEAVRGISQSHPYHHLPCKAHLKGRPPVQTSAIFTHLPSCVRSPQSHLVCKAKPKLPKNPSIMSAVSAACDFASRHEERELSWVFCPTLFRFRHRFGFYNAALLFWNHLN